MMRQRQLGRGTRAVATTIGVLAALGLASCGGDSDDAESTAQSIASRAAEAKETASSAAEGAGREAEEAATTVTRAAEPEPIEVKLGKTGWYDGFAITLDDLTAEPSGFGASILINLTVQNLRDETGSLGDGIVESDGAAASAFWDLPDVPGEGKAKGTIRTDVDGELENEADLQALLGTMAVVFGEARDNQTRIPLEAKGKVESVEPKELALTGTLQQGQLIVDVLDGDLQPSYASGEKGKAELSVRVKISCAADCQAQGWNVDSSMFSVKAPDGTSAVADSRSRYCCDAIYPGTVSDNADNVLTFVVPLPGTGAYTLTYDNPSVTSQGTAPATFAITA